MKKKKKKKKKRKGMMSWEITAYGQRHWMCFCSPLREVLTTWRSAKSRCGIAAVRQYLDQSKSARPLIRGKSAQYTYTLVRNIIQLSVRRLDMSFNNFNKDKGLCCCSLQGQMMGVLSQIYQCRFFSSLKKTRMKESAKKNRDRNPAWKKYPQNLKTSKQTTNKP